MHPDHMLPDGGLEVVSQGSGQTAQQLPHIRFSTIIWSHPHLGNRPSVVLLLDNDSPDYIIFLLAWKCRNPKFSCKYTKVMKIAFFPGVTASFFLNVSGLGQFYAMRCLYSLMWKTMSMCDHILISQARSRQQARCLSWYLWWPRLCLQSPRLPGLKAITLGSLQSVGSNHNFRQLSCQRRRPSKWHSSFELIFTPVFNIHKLAKLKDRCNSPAKFKSN